MIDRAVAVFSGIHPKVVGRLAPSLRSVGIEPVSVGSDGSICMAYFERLAKQTLVVVDRELRRGDVRLTLVLISGLSDSALDLEHTAFYPALRRVEIRPEWRNNPSSAGNISRLIQEYIKSQAVRDFTRHLAAKRESRMLMPLQNTPSKLLSAEFQKIYKLSAENLSKRLSKEITDMRKSRSLKVADLIFTPAINNEQHPIRRCSDSILCDLKAILRFGVYVQPRFEFDVKAENSLKAKSFFLCDGGFQRISAQATHLNMRINDDFKEG